MLLSRRLRSYLEDIGFINKYQSGFRQNKSTDDHLFRLSQSVMESFNRGEHVVAAFLDIEKAFDNVWHNGLSYKFFMLDLPTKMTRWLSDFLVGPSYPSQRERFSFRQNQPDCRGTTEFCPESFLFLIYDNDVPKPHHRQTQNPSLQMTLLYGLLVKCTICSKTFAKGPPKTGKVVCQMENKTQS